MTNQTTAQMVDALEDAMDGRYRGTGSVADYDAAKATLKQRIEDLETNNIALADALQDLLKNAVVLSADYLEAFRNHPNDATIQGWDKARWLRALDASKKSRAALSNNAALRERLRKERGDAK